MMDFQKFGGLDWMQSIISKTLCVSHYFVENRTQQEGPFSLDLHDCMLRKQVLILIVASCNL